MVKQELIDLLIERTAEHANKNNQKYIQQVAVWISKVFLTRTRTDITFEFDPPWDTSGETNNTKSTFNVKDYTSLDSFIENEYNGLSHPSFVDGMGMFHDYYSSELHDFTGSWVAIQVEETIAQLLAEENELLLEYAKLREQEANKTNQYLTLTGQYQTASEIAQLIYDDDIIGDFIVTEYPIELEQKVGKMDIKFY